MAGNLGLAHPQNLHQITDANFPAGDEVEQAEARRVGQGAEELVERKRSRLGAHGKDIIYGLTDMSNPR